MGGAQERASPGTAGRLLAGRGGGWAPQAGWGSRWGDWPWPSGHMEAPPPDVPGWGFPAFGTRRLHKAGIHGEALNSLRNEAGFK